MVFKSHLKNPGGPGSRVKTSNFKRSLLGTQKGYEALAERFSNDSFCSRSDGCSRADVMTFRKSEHQKNKVKIQEIAAV